MPCKPAEVRELALHALPRIVAQLLPRGSWQFGGMCYTADSPLAKQAGGNELRVNRSGTWSDRLSGRHGDDAISLFAYVKAISPGAATVFLSKLLDPADRFLDRATRASDLQHLADSNVQPRADDLNKILAKRALTPKQRAEELLKVARQDAAHFDRNKG